MELIPFVQYHCPLNTMALWAGISFQNLMGLVISGLESLHDLVMVWLSIITIVVMILFMMVFFGPNPIFIRPDSEIVEKTWTFIPMLVLIIIAFPSIHLLCLQDSFIYTPSNSVKIVSNQWNWQSESQESYDHLLDSDTLDSMSSYEIPIVMLKGINRVLLTSTDVLHSLGFPSLGIKLDSSPGRLNASTMEVLTSGLFYGSCYELCGSGHSVMPISTLII